mmetsp:Transcript_14299/g.28537  ORF Transcript_14299/g.28537 Transcript_14299/m.28537 type:complete len:296 (+) Transcript_14299:731-1618(+)
MRCGSAPPPLCARWWTSTGEWTWSGSSTTLRSRSGSRNWVGAAVLSTACGIPSPTPWGSSTVTQFPRGPCSPSSCSSPSGRRRACSGCSRGRRRRTCTTRSSNISTTGGSRSTSRPDAKTSSTTRTRKVCPATSEGSRWEPATRCGSSTRSLLPSTCRALRRCCQKTSGNTPCLTTSTSSRRYRSPRSCSVSTDGSPRCRTLNGWWTSRGTSLADGGQASTTFSTRLTRNSPVLPTSRSPPPGNTTRRGRDRSSRRCSTPEDSSVPTKKLSRTPSRSSTTSSPPRRGSRLRGPAW